MYPDPTHTKDDPRRAIRFFIPGEPKGFIVSARSFNNRSSRYWKYCNLVRENLEALGVDCPLFADTAYPVYIHTRAYFGGGTHCDPGNVQKGVCDALFYGATGGDKHTGGSFDSPLYDREFPRVEVEIRGWLTRKKYADLVSYNWDDAIAILNNAKDSG